MENYERRTLIRTFSAATKTTEEEARTVLKMCEWDGHVATSMFALFSPKPRGWYYSNWIRTLARLSFDRRKKVAENFVEFFPRNVFETLLQGLDEESRDYLAIICIRAFANSYRAAEFAPTLETGKRELLPLFQQWARELKEMTATPAESLEYGVARGRFKELLNQTLPSVMAEANPVFRDIVEDVNNLKVPCVRVKQTALHISAKLGDVDLLDNLLEHKAKLDAKDQYGNTALHVGASHPNIVEALFSAAESANRLEQFVQQVNWWGQTALHLCHNAESARLLLGAVPNLFFVRDRDGNTALHQNVNYPSVVQFLLFNIDNNRKLEKLVQQVNWDGETALHLCKNVESAELLLQAWPTLLFAVDKEGYSVLHYEMDVYMLEVLLNSALATGKLEQFVQQVDGDGSTALHICGNAENARLLVKVSPDLLFMVDEDGDSVFHRHVDDTGMLGALLDAAKEAGELAQFVEQVDDNGRTALHVCENVESARLLARTLPNLLFMPDQEGDSVLHRHMDDVGMLGVLLDAAKEAGQLARFVHQVNNQGQTALHICRKVESAQLLLRAAPNLVFAKDAYGRTALHWNVNDRSMVQVLFSAIEDAQKREKFVQRINNNGETALHLCTKAESARLLVQASPRLLFAVDEDGDSVLHRKLDVNLLAALLDAAREVGQLELFMQQRNNMGRTALHFCGNAECAHLLLRDVPNLVFVEDHHGKTALHLHAKNSRMVQVILDAVQDLEQLVKILHELRGRFPTLIYMCDNRERARVLVRTFPTLLFALDDGGDTVLHRKVDNVDMVATLLDAAKEAGQLARFVHQVNNQGQTALHICRKVESAQLLLRAAPNLVFAKDAYGRTALHWNVNDRSMVQVLFSAIEDAQRREEFVQRTNNNGETALHSCTNVKSARLLLQASPRLLFALDKDRDSVLHRHVDDVGMLGVLLDVAKEVGKLVQFVKQVNTKGQTALHICRKVESAELLLLAFPGVASIQCMAGNTPLHMQAMDGSLDICRLLLEEYHVDVDAMNARGQMALHFACHFRWVNIVNLLLAKSPNLLVRDYELHTVLHCVFAREWDGDVEDDNYPTSILNTVRRKAMPIFDLLLAQEANAVAELVAARDVRGKTALHYWAKFEGSAVDFAHKFMLAGANGAAQDEQGDTVVHILCRNGSFSLVLYMIERWGVPIRVKNNAGQTALDHVHNIRYQEALQRTSVLFPAVTLRLAVSLRGVQSPWKRFPCDLFKELCWFLV